MPTTLGNVRCTAHGSRLTVRCWRVRRPATSAGRRSTLPRGSRVKVADLVAIPLQAGSAVRHRRVFHPLGILAEGRIERVAAPGVGLPVESADILGRVSKAVGTPGSLPDLIGLAWRMPPRAGAATPWDVLAVSAGSGLLTRFALRPTVSWTGTTLTTLMPLHRDDGWWWLKAQMKTKLGGGLSLNAVSEATSGGG